MKYIKRFNESISERPTCYEVKQTVRDVLKDMQDDLDIDFEISTNNWSEVIDISNDPIIWVNIQLLSYKEFTLTDIYPYVDRIFKYLQSEGANITKWELLDKYPPFNESETLLIIENNSRIIAHVSPRNVYGLERDPFKRNAWDFGTTISWK